MQWINQTIQNQTDVGLNWSKKNHVEADPGLDLGPDPNPDLDLGPDPAPGLVQDLGAVLLREIDFYTDEAKWHLGVFFKLYCRFALYCVQLFSLLK